MQHGARNLRFDVIVTGGGPAGLAAAIAASRMGRRVALIERHPVLGGMGTVALVNNFCRAHLEGQRLIIGGIFAELRQRLIERKAIYLTHDMEPYDPIVFAEEVRRMCEIAGVELFLGQKILTSRVPPDGISQMDLENKSQLLGRVVVDATGDATIAAAAGVACTFGRPIDHAVMPLTYCYMIGPVDIEHLKTRMPWFVHFDQNTGEQYVLIGRDDQVDAWVATARQAGDLTIQRDHVACISSVPSRREFVTVNFGRVFIHDPTDPQQLAVADAEGRKQVNEGVAFFRKYLPGFENVRLVELARQIGVRQSRQIVGVYTLTADDLLGCRQFDDVIAQGRYSIDIHEPGTDRTTMRFIPEGKHYDIPWRCLVPATGPAGLIVAGRSISATHEAMSSLRVSPSVMAIGEAAGIGAAIAARDDCAIRDVSAAQVQERLRATGGILE